MLRHIFCLDNPLKLRQINYLAVNILMEQVADINPQIANFSARFFSDKDKEFITLLSGIKTALWLHQNEHQM